MRFPCYKGHPHSTPESRMECIAKAGDQKIRRRYGRSAEHYLAQPTIVTETFMDRSGVIPVVKFAHRKKP